jgi:sulfotransferase
MPEQLTNVTRAMIDSMWEHRTEPIIIDKNRGWSKNMPASTILFQKEIKVIATVRDLPSIMASWLTLLHRNPNSFMDDKLREYRVEPSDDNRMAEMWFNMVKDCMDALQILKKDASNRLLLIDYDELIRDPNQSILKIEEFLDLPKHTYDFNNIVSDTEDDDLVAWGLKGMHKVRPKLEKICKHPKDILGEELYNRFKEIEKEYA